MNDCGCCEGLGRETPVLVFNRAGLNAIAYRVGTHSRFKRTMLARLAALPALKTRDDDDFAIALLDAWATVADVLTFYQERIANESYLRTATERESLLQLARLIGYALRPGVAASVYLAFTVESAPGSTGTATIDVGARVQSIPGPNEQPQAFETVERIDARAIWNAMKPRRTRPQLLAATMDRILFQGTGTNLSLGDALLIVAPNESGGVDPVLRRVASVRSDNTKQQTTVTLDGQTGLKYISLNIAQFSAGVFRVNALPFNDDTVTNVVLGKTWNASDLEAFARMQGFAVDDLYASIKSTPAIAKHDTGVFAMRKRAALFGYNAPDWKAMADSTRAQYGGGSEWPFTPHALGNILHLDAVYKEIKLGDRVVITRPGLANPVFARVTALEETAQSNYALSGKVTQLKLDTSVNVQPKSLLELRQTTLYIQPELLPLDEEPIPANVQGNSIQLDGPYPGLTAGQMLVVSGARADLAGAQAAETAVIGHVTLEGGFTTLTLVGALTNSYIRDSVTLNANVALATHGETTREILGSGDASLSYQQFQLKQPPLTYVSAPSESGADATLGIFVNDESWRAAQNLLDASPRDRIFVTRASEEGKTIVQFGDGKTGARAPTGSQNVRAVYRKGIGTGGNVKAGQLSLLLTRPLGVKEVINPSAASGGADAETIAQARSNAPLPLLTLGRIVSLRDNEDFARAFAGVAKSRATWIWDGQTRGVHVTIAGPGGAAIASDSPTYKNLLAAMRKAGDPYVPLRVQTYQPAYFQLAARIKIDPERAANSDKVMAAVERILRDQFSFDARAFGEAVALSQVIALIQSVAGVVAVDVNALYRTGDAAVLNQIVRAATPQAGADGIIVPAELLMLDPRPVDLGVMP